MSLSSIVLSAIRGAAPDTRGAFRPEAEPSGTEDHCRALLDVAYSRLREAHADRDRAAGLLREAEGRTQRARDLIEDAASATTASESAEASAKAAAQSWALAGSPDNQRPDQTLLDRATQAYQAAIDARVIADGARVALPQLQQAEEAARNALSSADMDLQAAVRGVLLARAEVHFAALAHATREFDEAAREVQALAKALAGRFHSFSSTDAASRLLDRIRGSLPEPPAHDTKELILHGAGLDADQWISMGKNLLAGEEAQS